MNASPVEMATVEISGGLLDLIHRHGEKAYPDEGAGLLLGKSNGSRKRVEDILVMDNAREKPARRRRYLVTAEDYMRGEDEAARRGLEVLGVFHSHPDHPNRPSQFDLEWAMPWFSYLITGVDAGQALSSRSWRLSEDRSVFEEEKLLVSSQ